MSAATSRDPTNRTNNKANRVNQTKVNQTRTVNNKVNRHVRETAMEIKTATADPDRTTGEIPNNPLRRRRLPKTKSHNLRAA